MFKVIIVVIVLMLGTGVYVCYSSLAKMGMFGGHHPVASAPVDAGASRVAVTGTAGSAAASNGVKFSPPPVIEHFRASIGNRYLQSSLDDYEVGEECLRGRVMAISGHKVFVRTAAGTMITVDIAPAERWVTPAVPAQGAMRSLGSYASSRLGHEVGATQ